LTVDRREEAGTEFSISRSPEAQKDSLGKQAIG